MLRHLFCEKCSLQFGKKYVFDLHLSLVHGEKIEIKSEPLVFEENLQGIQISEKEFSNQVKNEETFEELDVRNEPICEENLQKFQKSEKESSNQVQNEQLINKENFEEIEVKKEPICEGIQINEKELSKQVKTKQAIYKEHLEELEVKNNPHQFEES